MLVLLREEDSIRLFYALTLEYIVIFPDLCIIGKDYFSSQDA